MPDLNSSNSTGAGRWGSCPLPEGGGELITLAHGSGGRLTQRLIDDIFVPAFGKASLASLEDAATIDFPGSELAFTTDSFVIHPLFFSGGDIGQLAISGTVNDLAMVGSEPLFLSVALVIEEGLPIAVLKQVVASMAETARAAGVQVVTGDTKVVERGKGDGVFITTSGIGRRISPRPVGSQQICKGDALIVSGDVGRHGMAVMVAREGLKLEGELQSDVASLNGLVTELFNAGIAVHCMRDLTRGGLATAAVELAEACQLSINLNQPAIPVSRPVQAACELLGLDPHYVANEGRFLCLLPADQVDRALAILHSHPLGANAAVIGSVDDTHPGWAMLESAYGTRQKLSRLAGDQLPRIC